MLWCALVNPHRDPQEHPEPFMPFDVHPLLEKPEESGEPDWALWHKVTQNAPVHTLDMRKLPGAK